ncbi:aspartyl-phosphate phosphatase Spo0E family protein [Bacillus taeanensis]|uniref:aspartyl-phosphate phosphatase Spo0E family protein n=1 Tax=Bacillus taeanensis TaxID=273032 RepID=UPI0015F0E027|nr:aspartyl-phosphate phosphatase Spo0E family protein [Bacillus taeanensis]
MSNQKACLLEKIERSRKKMHDLAKQNNFTFISPELIAISTYIDKLINEYEEIKNNKKQ